MNNPVPLILSILMAILVVFLIGVNWEDSTAQAGVEQTEQVIPEFKPQHREFKLDDGTPCVMVWTRQTNFPREGSSGVSCNWKDNGNE